MMRAAEQKELSSSGGKSTLAKSSSRSGGGQAADAPSVSRALPPVGWQSTLAHEPQMTTVCACEKTVVMAKQPGKS
jgi:hypothetical protein